jgi:hypothetical protein
MSSGVLRKQAVREWDHEYANWGASIFQVLDEHRAWTGFGVFVLHRSVSTFLPIGSSQNLAKWTGKNSTCAGCARGTLWLNYDWE